MIHPVTSIHRVLPEELQAKLMNLRDAESAVCWEYGAVANEVYAFVVANGLAYTKLEVCAYVSFMVDNNRAANTILAYARTASFFADKKAHRIYDFLPFSHFELAMEFGDNWRQVLEKSAELMAAHNGRPPSRAKLEVLFRPQIIERYHNEPERKPLSRHVDITIAEAVETTDPLAEVSALLSRLQAWLPSLQQRYPVIAPLLAQALLLIQDAIGKTHETVLQDSFD